MSEICGRVGLHRQYQVFFSRHTWIDVPTFRGRLFRYSLNLLDSVQQEIRVAESPAI